MQDKTHLGDAAGRLPHIVSKGLGNRALVTGFVQQSRNSAHLIVSSLFDFGFGGLNGLFGKLWATDRLAGVDSLAVDPRGLEHVDFVSNSHFLGGGLGSGSPLLSSPSSCSLLFICKVSNGGTHGRSQTASFCFLRDFRGIQWFAL